MVTILELDATPLIQASWKSVLRWLKSRPDVRNQSQPLPIFLISTPPKKMCFITIGFLTCALVGTTVIASNCRKGLYYCRSVLLTRGMSMKHQTSPRLIFIIYQAITLTKSVEPWLQQVRARTLTTSIIHFSSASMITISMATSTSLCSVQRVVIMEVMGIVIPVNYDRKSGGDFYIGWPYHLKLPNRRFFGYTDRVTKNIHGQFHLSAFFRRRGEPCAIVYLSSCIVYDSYSSWKIFLSVQLLPADWACFWICFWILRCWIFQISNLI